MCNCELFSVKKSKVDFEEAVLEAQSVETLLSQKGIQVRKQTEISLDPKKIDAALSGSINAQDAPDMYIFLNALNTADGASFKEAFYEFISNREAEILKESDEKTKRPKIRVFSLGDLGNGYKGYCFRIRDKRFIVLPFASLTGESLISLITAAVDKSNEIFESSVKEYPDGISYISSHAADKKKEGFFASFFPHKGDSPAKKARKIGVLVAIVAFIGALIYVINFFVIEPARNNRITSEIQEIAYRTNSQDSPLGDDELSEQDWDALKKVNSEIVGWLKIDDTHINYPVLEHKGDSPSDQYYLYRNYKKESDTYGSVFIDYRCKESVNSRNLILHGHNIQTGVFFHDLLNYGDLKGNLDYYKKHPVITFNTPEGDAKWKIISVIKTSTLYEHGTFFNYMQGSFGSDAEFMNFVYNLRVRSLFNIPVMVNENDQILTLSTCSYEFTGWRTVVVARRLRDGEDEKVDVGLATLNSSPLFPEIYYSRYGGARPEELTFKTANAKGLVSWYDGKGDLKGDETLTATVAANPTQPPEETENTKNTKSTTAPQTEEIMFYTVTFMNYDGSEFQSFSVKQGDSVSYPELNPTMPEDDYYIYTFKGWDTAGLDLQNVRYSMNIAPKFEPTLKEQ